MAKIDPREFLRQLKYITVAVVDENQAPWAVPVAVQKYKNGSIEWFSKSNTVHSLAIKAQPNVALTAFVTKDSEYGEYGFYAKAKVGVMFALPGGIARYKAEITEAWYNDAKHVKTKIDTKDL